MPEMHLALAHAVVTRLIAPDPDACARAAQVAERAGDPWTAATARLHEADAAAATGAAARAADALRAAHDTATRLGARPLLDDIAALSRRARISVEVAAAPTITVGGVERLGLTPREAEVLALVAAGRTNREIGTRLYVSEKTASVHVSNILRKLGVTTRVEAAAVAQRLGVA
jgi:DNA-binding NarL/FixJ family response regulator